MEATKPLISVIVPVYNVEPYLRRCVDSILAQTYENLEIILVDDGSTDRSSAICDEYADKDARVRVIHKENGGSSDARNAGISIAKGKWIGFVDSDDFIEPEMYQELLFASIRNNAEIACCGRYIFSEKRTKAEHCFDHTRILSSSETMAELLLNNATDESVWDKLFISDLFAGIHFPIGEINEDLPVLPVLFRKSRTIVHTGKPYYYYRTREGSISKSSYSRKSSVVIRHMQFVSAYVRDHFPELQSENSCFQVRYANMMMGKILMLPSASERAHYRADYRAYLSVLLRNYWRALQNRNFARKHKMKATVILLGLYRPATKLRVAIRKRAES